MRLASLVLSSLCVLTLTGAMLGCAVYKSSDRDDFDANGKARAPAQKATPLSEENRVLLANPCSAFQTVALETLKSIFGPSLQLSMTNQVSPKTSTCLVINHEALKSSSLKTVSILTCSWKPVDGSAIPVSDVAPVAQTTEDDLRAAGFDYVTGSVTSGEALRMNCEVFAPTTALIREAQENDDRDRTELTSKYVDFDLQLRRNTLTSTSQP